MWVPPWERPGLLGFVLGNESLVPSLSTTAILDVDYRLEPPPLAADQLAPVVEALDEPLHYVPPAKMARTGAKPDESVLRTKIILAWKVLLEKKPDATDLGRIMIGESDSMALQSLTHALVQKATATLEARLSAISQFLLWEGMSGAGWPPSEAQAYLYFCSADGARKAKTRASRFLEAVKFYRYTMGWRQDTISASARLVGFSVQQMCLLGNRKQSARMLVAEVASLENLVLSRSTLTYDRVIAGAVLVQVSLRARQADLGQVSRIWADHDMIVAEVKTTKTAAPGKDRLGLTMLGPLLLVTGKDWFSEYVRLREKLCIPMGPFAIAPAQKDSVFLKQPMIGQHYNMYYQQLLLATGGSAVGTKTSHGCKAFLLDLADLFGMSREVRKRLGYHKLKENRSMESYSRDSLSRPVELVVDMMSEIRKGTFRPDEPRGQRRITPLAKTLSPAEDIAGDLPVAVSESIAVCKSSSSDTVLSRPISAGSSEIQISDESSSESDCESDNDSALTDEASASHAIRVIEHSVSSYKADGRRFVNVFSKKIHSGRLGEPTRLFCGRKLSLSYKEFDGGSEEIVFCSDCSRLDCQPYCRDSDSD